MSLQTRQLVKIKVAACQPTEVLSDESISIATMLEYSSKAQMKGAVLTCFPECYLQGYIVEPERSRKLAISLDSDHFSSILAQLGRLDITIVFGLIEIRHNLLFNTAVVVKKGSLLGAYRKSNLTTGESKVFTPGDEYPVFDLDGIRFGINICYDLNFQRCAKQVAAQGAQLLVCPCNNMLRRSAAVEWKEKHNQIRALRCKEANLWLISSDVTGEREGRISYGPTAVISPEGQVVSQAELESPGMIIHDIAV
jgi:5-aminopentanamidase